MASHWFKFNLPPETAPHRVIVTVTENDGQGGFRTWTGECGDLEEDESAAIDVASGVFCLTTNATGLVYLEVFPGTATEIIYTVKVEPGSCPP